MRNTILSLRDIAKKSGHAMRRKAPKCALLALAILALAPPPPSFAQDITSGLVGHWPLDETSGTTAYDATGTTNGTYLDSTGSATEVISVAGPIARALDFKEHKVFLGTSPALDFSGTNAFTISAWVHMNGNKGRTIFTRGAGYNSNISYYFGIYRLEESRWQINFFDGTNIYSHTTDPNTVKPDGWVLMTITWDGDDIILYENGQFLSSRNYSGVNLADHPTPAYQNTSIGALGRSDTGYFGNFMDDVRVYDRALTQPDIQALFESAPCIKSVEKGAAVEGEIIFNPDYAVMQYCDGAGWIDMGKAASVLHGQKVTGGGYDINGVAFNGTTHLTQSSLAGSDPRYVSGSFWVKRNTANLGTSQAILSYRNAGGEYFRVRFNTSNELVLDGQEAGVGTYRLLARTATTITDSNWHHVAFSIDSTNRALDQIYLDDTASVTSNAPTMSAFGGGEEAVIGSFSTGGSERLYGALGDLWIDFDNYMDFSDEATRRKFINADGRAVNLGIDGSLPIGTAPDIFLSGDTADWHTNKGLLAGFSETGTLTTETIPPPRDYQKKLVGWWKMNETAGTTLSDSSETGVNGTMNGGLSGDDSVTGPVGKALDFDGTDDTISFPTNSAIDLTTMTISMWIKPNEVITPTNGIILMENRAGGSNTNYEFVIDGEGSGTSNEGVLQLSYYNGGWRSIFSTIEPVIGEWQHLAMTIDSVTNTYAFYLNGVQTDIGTSTYDLANNFSNLTMSLGNGDDPGSSEYYDGQMDDVRIHNYALSEAEVEELYHVSSEFVMARAIDLNDNKVIRNNALIDVTDGYEFTGSFWFRSTATDHPRIIDTDTEEFQIMIDPTGFLNIRVKDPDGAYNINADYGSSLLDGEWHHVMIAANANTSTLQVYIDGVVDAGTVYGFDTDLMDFTADIWSIGGTPASPWNGLDQDIAEVWFDLGTFVDLSVEANRLKFIKQDGYAAELGTNGELVTGTAPDLYFTGNASNWFMNKGTGGEFATSGTLLNATTSPFIQKSPRICADSGFPSGTLIYNSDEEVMSYCDGYRDIALGPPGDGGMGCSNPSGEAGSMVYNQSFATLQYCDGRNWRGVGSDPVSGFLSTDLVGHWRFDETEGGVAYDSSGNGLDLGMAGGMIAGDANTTGVMGGAFEFNGAANYLRDVTDDPLLRISQNTSFTVSAWVNLTSNGSFHNVFRYDDLDGADGDNINPRTYLIYGVQEDGRMYFSYGPSNGTTSLLEAPAGSVPFNSWHLITGVRDIANDRHVLYVDGQIVAEQTDESAGTWETTGQYLMIGRYENNPPGEYFSGAMDDARLYRRALSDLEVAALYNTTGGTFPGGCSNIGDACSDGSYYVGLSPEDGARVYMTSLAYENTTEWDENPPCPSCGLGDTASTSITDGRANTQSLRNYNGDNAIAGNLDGFSAAKYCDNLTGAHGHSDWYLPAGGADGSNSEINLLWTMIQSEGSVGGLNTSGGYYWTSSEYNTNSSRVQRFNNGLQSLSTKGTSLRVRCFRR